MTKSTQKRSEVKDLHHNTHSNLRTLWETACAKEPSVPLKRWSRNVKWCKWDRRQMSITGRISHRMEWNLEAYFSACFICLIQFQQQLPRRTSGRIVFPHVHLCLWVRVTGNHNTQPTLKLESIHLIWITVEIGRLTGGITNLHSGRMG